MFSVHSNIWFYVLLCSCLCTTETKSLESTHEIIPENKDDNLLKNNIIAMIQRRMNNDAIKKSLDDFTMLRRKTHFSFPGIINNGKNIEKDKSVVYQIYRSNNVGMNNLLPSNYVTTPRLNNYDNNFNEINITNDGPEIKTHVDYNEYENLIDIEAKNDVEYLYNKYKENNYENFLTPEQETELLKVLRKQSELINKIKRTEKKSKGKDKAGKKKDYKKGDKKKDPNTAKKKDSKDTKTTKKNDSKDAKTTKKKDSKDTKTTKKNDSKDGKTTKKKDSKDTKTTKKKDSKDTKTTKKNDSKDAKGEKSEHKKDKNKDKTKEKTKKSTTKTTTKTTTVKKVTQNVTTTTTTTKPTPTMRKPADDFEDLIAEYEKKSEFARKLPNYTPFTFETTTTPQTTKSTITTTTTKPSTVLTIINEIEVRSALRNNPFVKRILQMANRKRQKYLKESLIKIVN